MMKRIFSIVVFLVVVLTAQAQLSFSNSVTYQTINNTTNLGASSIIGTAKVSGQQIYMVLQNGGIASTNALKGWFQISFDNTNWTTVQTYIPAATNSAIESPKVSVSSFTIFGRVALATTNSVNVGASIQYVPFTF